MAMLLIDKEFQPLMQKEKIILMSAGGWGRW